MLATFRATQNPVERVKGIDASLGKHKVLLDKATKKKNDLLTQREEIDKQIAEATAKGAKEQAAMDELQVQRALVLADCDALAL